MTDPLAGVPADLRDRLTASPPPQWVPPMLATLTSRRFSDPEWIFERKLDGERCLGYHRAGDVRLLSRNRKRLDDTYPEVAEARRDGRAHPRGLAEQPSQQIDVVD